MGNARERIDVIPDIPQGPVRGPILVVIFISDMLEAIDCCMKLYADDEKIYTIG